MKNFFNAIGVADMEKVHSAMIAWILDDENDNLAFSSNPSWFTTFPQPIRSQLLCGLFGINPAKVFCSIKTHVEWNDIDIMIETKDLSGCDEVWVIENKLKSQEHMSNVSNVEKTKWGLKSNEIWQTEKYMHIIQDHFATINDHYLLLSLGRDMAKSSGWLPYTFQDFYELLQSLLIKVSNPHSYVLIEEYANSIGTMVNELNKFLNSTCLWQYEHVFNKLKKSEKSSAHIHAEERYIVENELETIFQKQFLAKLINVLFPGIKNKVKYDERNGIAMFIKPIQDINDFELNIEFQGGTFKVSLLHKDYILSDSYKHTPRLYGKWNANSKSWNGCVYNEFENIQKHSQYSNWKIARSKNLKGGKAKPRIALDKSIGKNWFIKNQNILDVYNEAEKIANEIKKKIPTIP